jgi:deoxyribonuclease V
MGETAGKTGSGTGIPDIRREIALLIRQIPRGTVSTYSAVADALGDRRATLAVADIVKRMGYETCAHRVVSADGLVRRSGDFPDADAIRLLQKDGVPVSGGRAEITGKNLFTAFKTDYPLRRLRKKQKSLARKVKLSNSGKIRSLAGIDVAYSGDDAFGAAAVYDLDSCRFTGVRYARLRLSFPYIPTYLFYREFPMIELLSRQLESDCALLIDGNGVLHPFGLGVASQAGVDLGRVSIGVAKSLLCGRPRRVPEKSGGYSGIFLDGRLAGYCLRPSAGRKLVYVSPGHRITHKMALSVNTRLFGSGDSHPLILAHRLAGDYMRKYRTG